MRTGKRPAFLEGKKILAVFAHPDDEIIFGWPLILARGPIELLICSSDHENAKREWCRYRREALAEVCELLEIPHQCFPFPSEFSRLPHRPENKLGEVFEAVKHVIRNSDADVIFTHNPHGEYGNTDHRLLHQWVTEMAQVPILFTDMFFDKAGWPVAKNVFYYRHPLAEFSLSPEQHSIIDRCKEVYIRRNAWTWDFPIEDVCYLVRMAKGQK